MGKMDPTQMDRWWKSRIEKEELQYGVKNSGDTQRSPRKEHTILNTLGQPQVVPSATEAHLSGAGAIVRQAAPQEAAPAPPAKGGSVASHARGGGDKAGSSASYPRTPQFSQAGSSATTIMRRLEGLEDALATERVKRMAAEEEMRQLMALAAQRKQ